MASWRTIIRKILPFALLAMAMIIVVIFYASDYQRPPCCDTAITLSRAEWIVKTGSLNPISPYNPSSGAHLYNSFISTEIVGHLLLAFIYWVAPVTIGSLLFAKWFILGLFVLPIIPLFFLARRIFRSSAIAFITVMLTYFGFWYGNMLWTGHVAQMIACTVIPIGVWFLMDFSERPNWKSIFWIGGILVALFFIHVLSFLLFWIISVSTVTLVLFPRLRQKEQVLYVGAYTLFTVLLFTYLIHTPRDLHLLPQFAINSLEHPFRDTIALMLGGFSLLLLAILGSYQFLRASLWVVPSWFLSCYLLSQSQTLGTPFYPSRFDEFIMVPIALLVGMGIRSLFQIVPKPGIRFIVAATVIALFLPYGMYWQNQLKKCYVSNCPTLHPTQVPDNDRQAFVWMKQHMKSSDVVIGWPQFAYFIPVVSGIKTEIAEGDKRIIFTSPDATIRANAAKKLGITYIFWDGIFTEFKNNVRDAEDFSEAAFQGNSHFELVKDFQGARIYAVK